MPAVGGVRRRGSQLGQRLTFTLPDGRYAPKGWAVAQLALAQIVIESGASYFLRAALAQRSQFAWCRHGVSVKGDPAAGVARPFG